MWAGKTTHPLAISATKIPDTSLPIERSAITLLYIRPPANGENEAILIQPPATQSLPNGIISIVAHVAEMGVGTVPGGKNRSAPTNYSPRRSATVFAAIERT